eukprot:CAMPEP_0170198196 /NCGR_PEP_ID=MMETSP0040_2-20121228/68184_1 /TAXON_ID=641309 /ORGANISM="Lotharella oceanica, Strain CCMP622" /LENGTH=119 /DNA_ID=CAMNT_0010448071 /DNA_START=148 /DNA_END=507 /DNA_ORIENTATION=-
MFLFLVLLLLLRFRRNLPYVPFIHAAVLHVAHHTPKKGAASQEEIRPKEAHAALPELALLLVACPETVGASHAAFRNFGARGLVDSNAAEAACRSHTHHSLHRARAEGPLRRMAGGRWK